MALKFAKKAEADIPNEGPKEQIPHKLHFLHIGKAAHTQTEQAEAATEAAQVEAGKLFRFWMPADGDRTITFLDGTLDGDGLLDIPCWWEHFIKGAGRNYNIVCPANIAHEPEDCPICNMGSNKPNLVYAMTIIDHTPYKIKQGTNAGKIIEHSKKLFVHKRTTNKSLIKIAAKHGGTLTGCTFEVSRSGDKDPAVGNQYDFVEQNDLEALRAVNGWDSDLIKPVSYEDEIIFRSAEEIVVMGLGQAHSGPGTQKPLDPDTIKKNL